MISETTQLVFQVVGVGGLATLAGSVLGGTFYLGQRVRQVEHLAKSHDRILRKLDEVDTLKIQVGIISGTLTTIDRHLQRILDDQGYRRSSPSHVDLGPPPAE